MTWACDGMEGHNPRNGQWVNLSVGPDTTRHRLKPLQSKTDTRHALTLTVPGAAKGLA